MLADIDIERMPYAVALVLSIAAFAGCAVCVALRQYVLAAVLGGVGLVFDAFFAMALRAQRRDGS
jgi:hypothetical protein